jgi:hypothetical protein
MQTLDLSAKPLANPAVVFQACLDDWAVLVNLDTAASLALNPTGIIVWQLVDGRRSVQEIVAAVGRRFQDAPASMPDDVRALLDTLAEDGFVGHVLSDATAASPQSVTPQRRDASYDPGQMLPGKLRRLVWRRGG